MYLKKLIFLFFFNLVFISFCADKQNLQLQLGLFVDDIALGNIYPRLTFDDAIVVSCLNKATFSYYQEKKQQIIKSLQPVTVYFISLPTVVFKHKFGYVPEVDMGNIPGLMSFMLPFTAFIQFSNIASNNYEERKILLIGYLDDHAVMCVRNDYSDDYHDCYTPFKLLDKGTFRLVSKKYDTYQKEGIIELIEKGFIALEEDLDDYYEKSRIRFSVDNVCYLVDHVIVLKKLWEMKNEELHYDGGKIKCLCIEKNPHKNNYPNFFSIGINDQGRIGSLLDGKLYSSNCGVNFQEKCTFKLPWSEKRKHYLEGIQLIQEQKKLAEEKAKTQEKLKKSNDALARWKKFWGCLLLGYVATMSVIMYKLAQQYGYLAKS